VPLVVIYDACVLFPAPLRDLLLRLAERGLVRARWSDEILDEYFRNILAKRNDRRVVAAAMKADARVIVTFNLRDFPDRTLSAVQIEAQHPDKFILNLLSLDDATVAAVIREQAADLKNPHFQGQRHARLSTRLTRFGDGIL